MEKTPQLLDLLPKGWVGMLAKKYQIHRHNLVLMLKCQIRSDRSKVIRSEVKQQLIRHYEAQLQILKNDNYASF